MTGPDLAQALTGKPLTTTRIRKCLRHITGLEQYQAFLEQLTKETRATVALQLDDQVKAKYGA